MLVRLISILLTVLLVAGVGCRDKTADDPLSAKYTGVLWFDLDPDIIGQSFEDTVELTVEGGRFWFATLVHTDQSGFNPPLCDCQGNVSGFGENNANFIPTSIDSTDCRAKWTISGEFATVFRGDSLIMTREVVLNDQTAEYLLRLTE